MPTYVYGCRDCYKNIEVVQRFSDDPLTVCPHCGGALQRLLFPPAIIFKGSGWYCTDHRSPSGNGPSAAEPKETAASKSAGNGGEEKEAVASESTSEVGK